MAHPYSAPAVTLDGTGAGVAEIRHQKIGVVWVVSQVSATTVPPALLQVQLLVNGLPVGSLRQVFSGAAASGPPPLHIGQSDVLGVQVTNGPPNAQLQVLALFDEESAGVDAYGF